MRLTLHTQVMEHVVVVRCQGRIVAGVEVDALQAELDKQTEIRKKVVLHLAEVDYIDSSGLGALVRAFGVLRAAGGSLKLCQVSPFVLQVLQVTKLLSILPTHDSEREAIEASYGRSTGDAIELSGTRIVCIDTSRDLLAYVRVLLTSSGYEVHTASNLADAKTLVSVMKPQMVICGAGMLGLPTAAAALEKFRQTGPNVQVLHLPSDFSTAEAGQAGKDLVNRVQSLLTT
jgi:anti-sigma B factor antagonist